jgi:hypothetical protein
MPSTSQTTAPPGDEAVYLVFGDFGLGLVSGAVMEPFCPLADVATCPDGAIREALPDLMGGVVYVPVDEQAIRWLRHDGEQPETIVPPNELGVRALDVEVVDGAPSLLYAIARYEDEMGATNFDVLLRNLDTGEERRVFAYGTFEGGLIQASIGRSYVSDTEQGSSDQGSARFHGFDGRRAWPPYRPEKHSSGMGDCWQGAFAPGTDRFAYVGALSDCGEAPWELKTVDLQTGERSTVVLDLDGPVFDGATDLEAFDDSVLVSWLDAPPFLVRGESVTVLEGVPASVYDLVEVDRPEDCPGYAVSNGGGSIWCMPVGGVRLWRDGA